MKKLIATLLMLSSTIAVANDSYMGEILGAVAGGVIGNQVGGGSGKIVTTAIGASIGGIVGGRIEDNMNYNRYGYDRYERNEVIYRQPQVYYAVPAYRQHTRITYQNCSAWIETMDHYGTITRTRTCY
jgi:uncharacterized protein YcfJ